MIVPSETPTPTPTFAAALRPEVAGLGGFEDDEVVIGAALDEDDAVTGRVALDVRGSELWELVLDLPTDDVDITVACGLDAGPSEEDDTVAVDIVRAALATLGQERGSALLNAVSTDATSSSPERFWPKAVNWVTIGGPAEIKHVPASKVLRVVA